MGVYAKGMEMPKTCFDCIKSGLQRIVGCTEWKDTTAGVRERFRVRFCPLVEVPEPHGRLIDADVLCERLMTKWLTDDESGKKIIPEVMSDVVTPIVVGTPTAIEAEGE